jgi:hypothetical protein
MKILRIKQPDGTTTDVPLGKGIDGKSAYQYAKDGGYTGTEAEFAEDINPDNIKADATPELGVDYFTDNDQNNIISRVYELIKNGGVVGFVNENNDIILSGKLADDAYTVKYEMEDGTYIEIGTLEIGAIPEPEPTYTNLANPASADWFVGKRFNSAGALVDVDSGVNGATTNYIGGDFIAGDIVRVKNMDLTTYRVAVYDSAKTFKITTPLNNNALASYVSNVSVNSSEAAFTINADTHLTNGGYIRFCGPLTGTSKDVIITKNEPIA